MRRQLFVLIVMLGFAQAPMAIAGQTPSDSGANPNPRNPVSAAQESRRLSTPATAPTPTPATAPARRAMAPKTAVSTAPNPNSDGGSGVYPQPQIIVTGPETVAPSWTLHERIAWGANIILAVLGYIGILLALRMLRSIDRHTENGVTTAEAALNCAQAALEQTQVLVRSERPWIAVTIEPFLTMENSFKVMATNRGRTPARIIGTVDRVTFAVNEAQLPQNPEYENPESNALPESIILLPGQSVGVRAFSRDDVRAICKTGEAFERIKRWQENIFLHGRVAYVDMIAPVENQMHETDWCFRYIHGDKNSALVIAGPPDYNKHT